eukprot:Amastigsp_a842912_29.p5 type:complete len:132 gc:universal Amastigsp_a842912_29:1746-2141(+)
MFSQPTSSGPSATTRAASPRCRTHPRTCARSRTLSTPLATSQRQSRKGTLWALRVSHRSCSSVPSWTSSTSSRPTSPSRRLTLPSRLSSLARSSAQCSCSCSLRTRLRRWASPPRASLKRSGASSPSTPES